MKNPKKIDLAKTVEAKNEIVSARDTTEIAASVKEILKDGTPDWVRFPKDYTAMAKEDFARERERTDTQVAQYKFDNQDQMTCEKNRLVNFIDANRFLHRLRGMGVVCKVYEAGKAGTVGLYAMIPGKDKLGFVFITSMQVPVMPEWSLLGEDGMGLPAGETAIGWRQVLFMLCKERVITEAEMYREFGKPAVHPFTSRHRRALYELRSGFIGATHV